MRAEAAGDPGTWRRQAILGCGRRDADTSRDVVRDYPGFFDGDPGRLGIPKLQQPISASTLLHPPPRTLHGIHGCVHDTSFAILSNAAPVAQRIEHLASDQAVGGSSPSGRTIAD